VDIICQVRIIIADFSLLSMAGDLTGVSSFSWTISFLETIKIMLTILAIIILAYLLGSIPSAVIISKTFKGIDIRDYGSKNAGFTNVYRVLGVLPAIIVLIMDVGKGMAAVLLVTQISFGHVILNLVSLKILAGVSVILGHVFPILAGFKGGKGIATALGALFSLIPLEITLALIVFIVIVIITRYVSLGSLSAASFIFLALLFERYYLRKNVPTELLGMIFFLLIFIFYNHRTNIKRLLNGTENKFSRKRIQTNLKRSEGESLTSGREGFSSPPGGED
jgi:glycerol-3-phosphate acyltransferase PlsY